VAVTSRPRLRKTSINLGNFGGGSMLGNVSPLQSKVSSASHIKSLQSQRRVLERVIDLEDEVDDLGTRIKMQDESLLDVRKSLTNIRKSILILQDGQKVIIDNAREKDKIEKEIRKKEEQRLKRQEAEGALEADTGSEDIKKTDGSVEKKGKESKGFLDSIKNFFMFTIAGWFTDKTIKLVNAFASGNKDVINSVGKKLLGGLTAVGGIMLIAAAGIGPVLVGIGSLIGVLGGLLFNPVTLAALLIAVGVGGVVYGLKKLWDWGTKTASSDSAKKYVAKKQELDKRLKDAGMTRGGFSKDRSKQDIRHGKHGRTEEQEKIWQEVQAERKALEAAKKNMEKEISEAKTAHRLDIRAREKAGEDIDIKAEEQKWKVQEANIYKKFENKIGSISSVSNTGNGGNVTSNVNTSGVISNIGPELSSEGNITVIPLQKEQEISTSSDSTASSVDYIPSDNPNNIHTLSSKIQYGVVAG
tara:strand:- start:3134 stop:4549 length:1416 start_codon:yes stop_codon:yes gene_type:complete